MSSNPNFVKKQITVDTVSWTAVAAPVDCMGVSIKNSVFVDLYIRTDSGDATTQDTISAGTIETVAAPRHAGGVQDGGAGIFNRPHDAVRGSVGRDAGQHARIGERRACVYWRCGKHSVGDREGF